jgi:hypothetical protein
VLSVVLSAETKRAASLRGRLLNGSSDLCITWSDRREHSIVLVRNLHPLRFACGQGPRHGARRTEVTSCVTGQPRWQFRQVDATHERHCIHIKQSM